MLAKSKLLNWLKKKEQPQMDNTVTIEKKTESDEKQDRSKKRDEPKETPIKEYNETLYSIGSEEKKHSATAPDKKQFLKRTSWENSDTIEQNIDHMKRRQADSTTRNTQDTEDVDKKVDFILLKKKSRF